MDIITLDYETVFDSEYSLAKMTMQEYILDDRFEAVMLGLKVNDGETQVAAGTKAIAKLLNKVDWDNAMLVAHNAMFDAAVTAWRFGHVPKHYYCTMFASRPVYAPFIPRGRVRLADVASYISEMEGGGAGYKGDFIDKTRSIPAWNELKTLYPELIIPMRNYCAQDVDLCRDIFLRTINKLPAAEVRIIGETVRKYVQPRLRLDLGVLRRADHMEKLTLAGALQAAGVSDTKELRSPTKFAAILQANGVIPGTKISPRTGQQAYAFAKTDEFMRSLLIHNNPTIRRLAEAKIQASSTIKATRTRRLMILASISETFAVPILYYGAHTGRFSGYDKLNLQNLPRGSDLREAILPAPGEKLIVGDLAQIEARITAVLANSQKLVDAFVTGDPYRAFAANELYHLPEEEITEAQRFIGKMCILGLGFGMSATRFHYSVTASGNEVTLSEAEVAVKTYRSAYPEIPRLWKHLDRILDRMIAGGSGTAVGPVRYVGKKLILPNDMMIHYPDLHRVSDGYRYRSSNGWKKIYGAAMLENIVQALARIVLVEAELRMVAHGFHAQLSVHDELVYSHKSAEWVRQLLHDELTTPPAWLPNLPLEADLSIADNYKEAK